MEKLQRKVRPKVPGKGAAILTPKERRKLAGATLIHEDTIRRWESGLPVMESNRARLEETARKLGLPIPQKASRT